MANRTADLKRAGGCGPARCQRQRTFDAFDARTLRLRYIRRHDS